MILFRKLWWRLLLKYEKLPELIKQKNHRNYLFITIYIFKTQLSVEKGDDFKPIFRYILLKLFLVLKVYILISVFIYD